MRLRLVSVLWHRDCVTWFDNAFHTITWALLALSKNTETCFKTMYMPFISHFCKNILIVFTGKLSSEIATIKSLSNADNNWLKQIHCEFCNRYRCVSRILNKQAKWKSAFSRSAVSTHRLRHTVVLVFMMIPSQMAFQMKLFAYSVTTATKSSSSWVYQPTPNLTLIHWFLPRCHCVEDEDKYLCYRQLIGSKRAAL